MINFKILMNVYIIFYVDFMRQKHSLFNLHPLNALKLKIRQM